VRGGDSTRCSGQPLFGGEVSRGQKLTIDGHEVDLTLDREASGWNVDYDGKVRRVAVLALREREADLIIDGVRISVPFVRSGDTVRFFLRGDVHTAAVAEVGRGRRHKHHSMEAPMPGVVLKIPVAAGEVVSRGAPLIILEAMKMEHPIVAPYDGTVVSIRCAVGEIVQPGVELIELDPVEEERS
jgi:acetyl/propionyl-CoA carboxylase alpha subunit